MTDDDAKNVTRLQASYLAVWSVCSEDDRRRWVDDVWESSRQLVRRCQIAPPRKLRLVKGGAR